MKYAITILLLSFSSAALSSTEDLINAFIASKHVPSTTSMLSDTKHGDIVEYIATDDSSNEVLVHWIYSVANYWEHRITLVDVSGSSYKELSTIKSQGVLKNLKIMDNTINVTQIVYSPMAPRCCPDVEVFSEIELSNSKIAWRAKN